MCFSAGASFGAATVLTVVGVITLKKVTNYRQFPFASIPLMFAIQQFAEGFVWLSLSNVNYLAFGPPSSHIFLFFAQVAWPIWVPFSIFLLEKNAFRKKILLAVTGIGILVGSYLSYCLFVYPIKAEINSFHIDYSLNFPMSLAWIGGLFYLISTIFPAFISSVKRMQLLGILIATSYVFTRIFYAGYLISVWCFFAAIISVIIFFIVTKMKVSVLVAK